MTVKEETLILDATVVEAEPEIAVPPPTAPAPPPAASTTTTTTYTIPPPAAAPQQSHQQQPQQPSVVTDPYLGRQSTGMQCPYCAAQMVTRTRNRIDAVTVLAALLLLLLFWPLFWLPFCIPGCKTTDHYCSNCNRKVGKAGSCS